MLSFRYTRQTRTALTIIPLLLVVLTVVLDYNATSRARMDACFIRREVQRPGPTLIPLGDGLLHNLSVYVMWISMFILAALPVGRTRAFYLLTYSSIWFHTTYILLAALKAPLFDFNCAGRHPEYPNGISGHYCYFVFVALTSRRFALARYRSNPDASRIALALVAFLMTLFAIGATATLYRTFFHGYHSPRQIALGTALGMLSHVLLDNFQFREDSEPPTSISLSLLLANSLTSLTSYYIAWPHDKAGPAISQGQLVFHAALWVILIATAQSRVYSRAKVATD